MCVVPVALINCRRIPSRDSDSPYTPLLKKRAHFLSQSTLMNNELHLLVDRAVHFRRSLTSTFSQSKGKKNAKIQLENKIALSLLTFPPPLDSL